MTSLLSKLDKIWNKAVSQVGGSSNTPNNFKKIESRFVTLAKDKGYTAEEIYTVVRSMAQSTARFMD